LLRGFHAFAKPVPEGAKFRNTPSACGGDRNFEGFASLFFLRMPPAPAFLSHFIPGKNNFP
jgi:hypothetical protein